MKTIDQRLNNLKEQKNQLHFAISIGNTNGKGRMFKMKMDKIDKHIEKLKKQGAIEMSEILFPISNTIDKAKELSVEINNSQVKTKISKMKESVRKTVEDRVSVRVVIFGAMLFIAALICTVYSLFSV
jgi:hypothetical protein